MSELILMLAITCVAEVSFASTHECIYMIRINDQNAVRRGKTLRTHTMRFNSVWRRKGPSRARPWLVHLRLDGGRPKHWPHHRASWERYKRTWGKYIVAIHQYLLKRRPRRVRADDYGSAEDGKPCGEAVRIFIKGGSLQQYWDLNPCWEAKKGNMI